MFEPISGEWRKIMNKKCSTALGIMAATVGSLYVTSVGAGTVTYAAKYPPTDATADINASMDGVMARSMIASGLMGVKYFNSAVDVSNKEVTVLNSCKTKSAAGTSWPEACSFDGFVGALSATFSPQNWITRKETDQNVALSHMVNGLKTYKSPVLLPIYGHPTHWATVYEASEDDITHALVSVKFRDSLSGSQEDGYFDSGVDGKQLKSGNTFKNTFYLILEHLDPADAYYHKFALSYEPPAGYLVKEGEYAEGYSDDIIYQKAPPLIGERDCMDAVVAEQGVWTSLILAGVDTHKDIWPAIESSAAGGAWEVNGYTPSGEAWDYYVVPLYNAEGNVSAVVLLSAEDGAFEEIWLPTRPTPYFGISVSEANDIARREVSSDLNLWGGVLTWDPGVNTNTRSPVFPYYEYHVTSKEGAYLGRLAVSLSSGSVKWLRMDRDELR